MHTCSKKGQQHPGLHQQQCFQWPWGMVLLCTAQVTSGVLSPVSQYKRDMSILELVQFRATKMIKGLLWGETEAAETIRPREEKAQGGDFTHVHKSRTRGNEDEEAVVFPVVPSGRKKDSGANENIWHFIWTQEKVFYCESGQTLEVSETGCEVSIHGGWAQAWAICCS